MARFAVTAKYDEGTRASQKQTLQPPFSGEGRHELIIPFCSLYMFGQTKKKLIIEVAAIRNDEEKIYGDRVQIDVPTGWNACSYTIYILYTTK